MATMESLIATVNRIQRACTVLGDHGGDNSLPTLWEALPSVVVVGGQVLLFFLCVCMTCSGFVASSVLMCDFCCECRVRESHRCWRAL